MAQKTITNKKQPIESGKQKAFAIDKQNYKYLAIGFGIIVLGLILMLGGGSKDPNEFNYAMFSFTRITLAPILILVGFVVEIYAIMKKPKTQEKNPE